MQVRFTPAAAREILQIMRERGNHLALRIQIRQGPGGLHWDMRLEPLSPQAVWADGVPVLADAQTWRYLDGMVIDWTQTPEGPGIGVFSSSLHDGNVLTAG
ncbi:MAG TPA: hypothetical protein VIL07_00670 [Symbiobacteriaceae bacterium]